MPTGRDTDTLAALKHAQALGHAHTLAICNVATSSMVRQTALTFLTRAGTEVGVASTKAFTTQLVALFLLALQRVLLGPLRTPGEPGAARLFPDVRAPELAAVAPLVALAVVVGVFPRFLLDVIEPAARTAVQLVAR